MNLRLLLASRWHRMLSAFSGMLARRWKQRFYFYLAALFTVFTVLDVMVLHLADEMRQATFDAMVRYRLVAPKPDPDIVIVDIDEASLAAMSKDYGRWPWPRRVLGEFVEQVEKQQPKAVVFDILFSDPDVYNRESDAYFDAAIARTNNTFFPVLRLDPTNDSESRIKPAMIPGVTPMPDEEQDRDAKVAVILPYFKAAQNGGRLGIFNIYPDADGIARRYPVYLDEYGWMLPALPTRIAREFGWPEPGTSEMLLNWRGKPFTYHYASFSDVYADMDRKQKNRPQDEFKNKIVIIGSTAAGLFDLKATPVSRLHPGVEILATAIDNLKHGDSLRFPEGKLWYLLMASSIVWLTAWAFYRDAGRNKIDRLFGLSQFILIGFSYASINFTNTYINLTGPVMVGLVYFTLARTYATATGTALEQNMVRAAADSAGNLRATLLLIRFDTNRNVVPEGVLEKIRLGLKKSGTMDKSVEVIHGRQKGLWGLFEKTIVISWMVDAAEGDAEAAMRRDVDAALAALTLLLRRYMLHADNAASHIVHSGLISGGDAASAGWRALFAEALLEWDRQEKEKA